MGLSGTLPCSAQVLHSPPLLLSLSPIPLLCARIFAYIPTSPSWPSHFQYICHILLRFAYFFLQKTQLFLARNGSGAPFGDLNTAMERFRASEPKEATVSCITRVLRRQNAVFSLPQFFSARARAAPPRASVHGPALPASGAPRPPTGPGSGGRGDNWLRDTPAPPPGGGGGGGRPRPRSSSWRWWPYQRLPPPPAHFFLT